MATATTTTTAAPKPTAPAGETIRGADLFASGVYRGKTYTVADLERMAANFDRLKGQLSPPAVLGHEEEQEFLDALLGGDRREEFGDDDDDGRTDQPAAGWVDRVWVERYPDPATGRTEAILKGDITDVPPKIADMIRKKRYRKISAEVYDDYTDDFGRSHGKALRRVAFLGAEVPQVKRTGDIPAPTPFSERAPRRFRPAGGRPTGRGTYLCFAEAGRHDPTNTRSGLEAQVRQSAPGLLPATLSGLADDQLADLAKNLKPRTPLPGGAATPGVPPTMTRDELIAAITGMGEDPEGLADLTDEELNELHDELKEGGTEPPPEGGDPNAGGAAMNMADPASMTRDEMIAELIGMGQDPAQLESLDDEALREMLAGAGSPPAGGGPVAAMGGGGMGGMGQNNLMTYAERQTRKALKQLMLQQARLKRQQVETHCEKLVKDGKVAPAMVPIVRYALMRAEDTKKVVKFSEGGRRKTGTLFERFVAETNALPRLSLFTEKLTGGAGDRTPAAGKREELAVQRFAERNAEHLKAMSKTPEAFVREFAEARKRKPDLTATAWIGPDAAAFYD